jgi:hypothetical protein
VKTLGALKECDVALVVVDVSRHLAAGGQGRALDLAWERQLLAAAAKYGAAPLLLYNLRGSGLESAAGALAALQAGLDPESAVRGWAGAGAGLAADVVAGAAVVKALARCPAPGAAGRAHGAGGVPWR